MRQKRQQPKASHPTPGPLSLFRLTSLLPLASSLFTASLELHRRQRTNSDNSSMAALVGRSVSRALIRHPRPQAAALPATQSRHFINSTTSSAPTDRSGLLALGGGGSNVGQTNYFSNRPSLPTNTGIRFVPQQQAWVLERMGKFQRVLNPGLNIMVPFLDRIAYVKSLKENAIEIPSQSAITLDNVTLELDGVLYTRVFDAYKAR